MNSYLNVSVFFNQKTAYEMRISDWSSDVCSSDLHRIMPRRVEPPGSKQPVQSVQPGQPFRRELVVKFRRKLESLLAETIDLKSVVSGKSVSVRVDLCGRRIIKKK